MKILVQDYQLVDFLPLQMEMDQMTVMDMAHMSRELLQEVNMELQRMHH